jgi:hypothetical protein
VPFEWGVRLIAVLALIITLLGLLILALPEMMEATEILPSDRFYDFRVADLLGATLVLVGTGMTWATVLVWQRNRIEG